MNNVLMQILATRSQTSQLAKGKLIGYSNVRTDICCFWQSEDKADLAHPVKNRGCTDILVLLLFVLFWAGMVS